MTDLSQPKLVRTRRTFVVQTPVGLRDLFFLPDTGESESAWTRRPGYYHHIHRPLLRLKGCFRPSVSKKGVRYSLDDDTSVDPETVHEGVRQIILKAIETVNLWKETR